MDEVRQAHLPGNYELYDPDSTQPGAALCKLCWEDSGLRNSASLGTVWVATGEKVTMWWLCRNHEESARSKGTGQWSYVRRVQGAIRYPETRIGGAND